MARRRSPRRASPAASAALGVDALQAAVKSAEMLTAAAVTIGLRTTAMGAAWQGWRPHDHRENTRMVTEKMAAAGEFAAAAGSNMIAMQTEMLRLWTDVGAWSRLATLGLSGYSAMLKPYHTRTTANAKRLGRSKRR